MRKNDVLYFAALALMGIAVIGLALSHLSVFGAPSNAESAAGNLAPEVDQSKIQERIDSGAFSNHEAEFYHSVQPNSPPNTEKRPPSG